MGGFCCQVPPEPRPNRLRAGDFKSAYQTALSSEANLSKVVIRNYCNDPVTVGHAEQKPNLYYARRSCFAPLEPSPVLNRGGIDLVEAPGTAPGSATLIPSGVYHHSWRTSKINMHQNLGSRNESQEKQRNKLSNCRGSKKSKKERPGNFQNRRATPFLSSAGKCHQMEYKNRHRLVTVAQKPGGQRM